MGRLITFWVGALALTFISCSPEKLLQKAIEKGAKVTVDTVYKDVAVYVPQVRHDSIFTSLLGDTVTITKDRLQVKYVRLPGDYVFIEGTCLPDTVKVTVPVEVTRTISAGYSGWQVAGYVLGALFFAEVMAYGAYKLAQVVKKSNV